MLFNILDFENIDFKSLSDEQLQDLFDRLKSLIDSGDEELKNKILDLIKNIDGSGSGIDADLFDGLDSTQFLRKDVSDEPTQDDTFDLGSPTKKWKNIYATTFQGTAIEAEYADLAEKYICKDKLELGDVVCISENKEYEIEKCNEIASHKVIGVFSFNPAIKMNSKNEGMYIALKGRVPVKVIGPVKKGDPLISYKDGFAISIFNKNLNKNVKIKSYMIFGKALESVEDEVKSLIEVVIL